MAWRRIVPAAGALLALAACGLAVNGLGPSAIGGDAGTGDAPSTGGEGGPAGDDDATGPEGDDGASSDEHAGPDGAAPEGGQVDSGPPGPEAGGPSLCATAGLLFCDGFESGLAQWGADAVGGHSSPDGAHVFRGKNALHASVDAIPQTGTVYARQQHDQLWPADVFVRVFLYQASPMPPATYDFVELVGAGPPFPGVELRGQRPDALAATAFVAPNLNWASATALPLDRWACLEMEMDATSATFRAWLDDAPVADMTQTFTTPVPTYGILKVGLAYYQAAAQGPTELWIDEVAVDGTRIGCAK